MLLAEDNPVNQEIAIGLLESLDCAVTLVDNGREAVDAATGGAFDLVLMDCQMPVMNGLDATRAIRSATADDHRLPIVALTAHDFEDTRAECLAAGMDDLLGKPFSRQELLALLRRWRPALDSEPPAEPERASTAQTSTLDLAAIEALRTLDPRGERQLVERAIAKFADYSDERVACLADAVGTGDVAEVSKIAHSLKSSSASLGANDLSRQCKDLEKLTAGNDLPEDIEARLIELRATCDQTRRDLLKLTEAA